MVFRVGRTYRLSPQEAKSRDQGRQVCAYIVGALLVVGIPYWVYALEWRQHAMTQAFNEVDGKVWHVDHPATADAGDVGKLVHLTSNVVQPDELLADADFGVHVDGALRLSRNTEYCQWMEHSHEHEDDDGNRYVTYTYTLGWRSHPIPSIFFDQPGAHHNPMRDPFPSMRDSVSGTRVGGFHVGTPFIEGMMAPSQRVQWDADALRVSEHVQSPAVQHEHFSYVGDGTFYSAHEPSVAERLARGAMEYLEGSLFSWQLGDLFQHCHAGDIRVSYQAVIPATLSVVGKQRTAAGELEAYATQSGWPIALLHEGAKTAGEMFTAELAANHWWLVVARAALAMLMWAAVALAPRFADTSWRGSLAMSLCLSSGVLGAVWTWMWGVHWQTLVWLAPLLAVPMLLPPVPPAAAAVDTAAAAAAAAAPKGSGKPAKAD